MVSKSQRSKKKKKRKVEDKSNKDYRQQIENYLKYGRS
jgi:hypothetical protein